MSVVKPQDGVAVVTGAGSGLGRALAVELCARGFTVVGLGRRAEALTETAGLCGERFQARTVDVADAQAVAEAFAPLQIALLINNAAVYPRRDFLTETPETFAETVAVNLGGVVNCTHAALRDMAQRGQGRILNVATFADHDPLPASSAYSVSKGAARILTRAVIADVADRFPGIVISDWMPGMLQTSMGIPGGVPPEVSAKWGVALALQRDPSLTGTTFEMDREILPPRGLKGRIKDTLLMRKRSPRTLA
ncbi:SDR family oxidoreductase [Tropicibacter naphthalenivorans]|uniref:2-(R)-hydroxypropyl-CoM dehydrogenase n=1 Tax=Tropicibacter naphthalenivorans TaxID=441103 RepID=A0A0P1H0B5_9RHOB|nr:SDR family oxidoreductase [Tropicibacter naphthalenivorans]CUH79402.1 2-(R)-hydroxypropyl-CoM dehydrogenase [Tropicibacter naphthalenivorans]SMC71948.1 NADP-dependent 3-hydroxy acid dehydrogenase YdfG [Tropicibacter naphthalenivorans]